jgi:hypothetical protein
MNIFYKSLIDFLCYFFICFYSWSNSPFSDRFSLAAMKDLAAFGPCVLSSFKPVEQGCLSWAKNVDAAPYYDVSRRLIFTGSAANYLHVLDADYLKELSLVHTGSRVVTKPVKSPDGNLLAFATLDGRVFLLDSYTYETKLFFEVGSLVNNDLLFFENSLFFSNKLGTIYNIDTKDLSSKEAKLLWKIERPAGKIALKLSSNSNLLVYKEPINSVNYLLAPHYNGYISLIDINSGTVKKETTLATPVFNYDFPDIVAPLVLVDNAIYAASYKAGLFKIILPTLEIISKKEEITNIIQLTKSNEGLIASTTESLFFVSFDNVVKWKNNFSIVKTKSLSYGYPFSFIDQKPALIGSMSNIIIYNNFLIMASDMGGLGIFDLKSGSLMGIKGGLIGFGPKVEFYEGMLFSVSKAGSLLKYSF